MAAPSESAPAPSRAELFALGLVAASVIASQILLTRIFSFITWYHYTPLIIGIALLGFGFAGSYLSVRGRVLEQDRSTFLGDIERDALGFAVLLPLSLLVISRVRFSPSKIFEDWTQALWLTVYLLAAALPFGAAGLFICRLIDRYRARAGRVYGTDLTASATGVLLGLALLRLGAEAAIVTASVLPALAAVLVARENRSRVTRSAVTVAGLVALLLVALALDPDILRPPPSKEMAALRENRALGEVRFEVRRWHPIARVDVTAELVHPAPHFGGELSPELVGATEREHLRLLFQDGTAPSGFLALSPPFEKIEFLRGYLQSVAYKIRPGTRALVIGVGGGVDLAIALAHGASSVTGIEVNPVTLDLLRNDYGDYTGLARDPRVTLHNREGRAFARSTKDTFDVIQLSGADTHAALVSGSASLTEGYLYTVEAVSDFLDCLAPGGVLSYSRPYFVPPRETLKLLATAESALRLRGVAEPRAHIYMIGGRRWTDMLISPSPLSPADVSTLTRFADAYGFRVFASPMESIDTPWGRYLSVDEETERRVRAAYFFKIEPATDDRPFFYDYARWSKLLRDPPPVDLGIEGYYTAPSPLGTLPLGNALLVLALAIVFLLSLLFIVYPLRRRATDLAAHLGISCRVLVYFSSLGLAFIAVEVTLIQYFQLLLGGPALALATVLFSLLAAAGLGSMIADRLSPGRLGLVVPVLAAVLILEVGLIPFAIEALAAAPSAARLLAAAALTALPGVLMGMPFPLGIRIIAGRGEALVPWAWAANGLLSVCGSVLALFVAMMAGFRLVMAGAAAVYVLGVLLFLPLASRDDGSGQTE